MAGHDEETPFGVRRAKPLSVEGAGYTGAFLITLFALTSI